LTKPRRERITIPCRCGRWFSNAAVRNKGWFSKTEWLKKGYHLLPGQQPVAEVWRCVYWKGHEGGHIRGYSRKASAKAKAELEVIDGIVNSLDASDGGKCIVDAMQFLRRYVILVEKTFAKLAEESPDESTPSQP
jgi:hypothetical protein